MENIRAGYVFFYPSLGLCKIIEVEVTSELQFEELRQFEEWICKDRNIEVTDVCLSVYLSNSRVTL